MASLESIPQPNPAVLGRKVKDEAVLVIPEKGQVKVLNDVGARIWDLCDGKRSAGQIAEIICGEYQASPDEIQADVMDFLAELESRGIVNFLDRVIY